MTDAAIDYDKLATMVAAQLRTQSIAYAQANAALEDQWLREQVLEIIGSNSSLVARVVVNSYEFDQAFKTKLKSTIANIY